MLNIFGWGRSKKPAEASYEISELRTPEGDRYGYALLEEAASGRWIASYVLAGEFGNLVLGMPRQWRLFDSFFQSIGGAHFLMPSEKAFIRSEEQALFRRFGTRWLVGPGGWWSHVPTDPLDTLQPFARVFVTDPVQVRIQMGEWSLLGGVGPFLGKVDRYLHRYVNGANVAELEEQISVPQNSFESVGAVTTKIQKCLAEHGLVTWQVPGTNLIACYTDLDFERQDYDVLGGKARNQIQDAWKSLGVRRHTAHRFELDAIPIEFPRSPRLLTQDLLDKLVPDAHTTHFVTATQAALILLRWGEAGVEPLRALVKILPVNLAKMRVLEPTAIPTIDSLVADVSATSEYYRRWRVRGLIGRTRNPSSQADDPAQ